MPWRPVIDIAWSDEKLAKSCATERSGRRRWGADHWKLLKRRLAALEAAPSLLDMEATPGRCHRLKADRRDQFAVCLWGSYRLIFVPDHEPMPLLAHGAIDRGRVTRILILEVVDYHDD